MTISRLSFTRLIQEWLDEQPPRVQYNFRMQVDAMRNARLVYGGVVMSEQEAWVRIGKDLLNYFEGQKNAKTP